MTDSFGSFLKGYYERDRRELDNPLSAPRLILAAVLDGEKSDRELMDDTDLGDVEFKSALQLLADAKLVTVRPEKGRLMIVATDLGRSRA